MGKVGVNWVNTGAGFRGRGPPVLALVLRLEEEGSRGVMPRGDDHLNVSDLLRISNDIFWGSALLFCSGGVENTKKVEIISTVRRGQREEENKGSKWNKAYGVGKAHGHP